ncbi:putative mandelonitrile lyase [Cucumis melo var. makuwa]|uniref:Mandelonitrile lyase n=1 Tax=Cucumis melo var. makuwa TaxID=1194695 RepID=A0A5A7UT90_CUCMM|nr:putative mandelonitrile lyase [Cucumis melo var. makuwa]
MVGQSIPNANIPGTYLTISRPDIAYPLHFDMDSKLDWLRLSRPTFVEEFSSSLRVLTAIDPTGSPIRVHSFRFAPGKRSQSLSFFRDVGSKAIISGFWAGGVDGREWKVPLASLNLLRRRPQCPRPGSIVEPIKNSTEGVRPELKNWQSAVRDGLCSAGLDPYNGLTLDHSVGTSASTFESSGRRHS